MGGGGGGIILRAQTRVKDFTFLTTGQQLGSLSLFFFSFPFHSVVSLALVVVAAVRCMMPLFTYRSYQYLYCKALIWKEGNVRLNSSERGGVLVFSASWAIIKPAGFYRLWMQNILRAEDTGPFLAGCYCLNKQDNLR